MLNRTEFGWWLPQGRIERQPLFGLIPIETEAQYYYFIVACLLLVLSVVQRLRRSRVGRVIDRRAGERAGGAGVRRQPGAGQAHRVRRCRASSPRSPARCSCTTSRRSASSPTPPRRAWPCSPWWSSAASARCRAPSSAPSTCRAPQYFLPDQLTFFAGGARAAARAHGAARRPRARCCTRRGTATCAGWPTAARSWCPSLFADAADMTPWALSASGAWRSCARWPTTWTPAAPRRCSASARGAGADGGRRPPPDGGPSSDPSRAAGRLTGGGARRQQRPAHREDAERPTSPPTGPGAGAGGRRRPPASRRCASALPGTARRRSPRARPSARCSSCSASTRVDELDREAYNVLLPEHPATTFGLDIQGVLTLTSIVGFVVLFLEIPLAHLADRRRAHPIAAGGRGASGAVLRAQRPGPERLAVRRRPGRRQLGPGGQRRHPPVAARRLLPHRRPARACSPSTARPTRRPVRRARCIAGFIALLLRLALAVPPPGHPHAASWCCFACG